MEFPWAAQRLAMRPLVRMSTAEMLIELGYSVVEATTAEEALRTIENGGPLDLIVTDHLMPGLTGVDLALAVRDRLPGVPVLIISGFAEMDGFIPTYLVLRSHFARMNLPQVSQNSRRASREFELNFRAWLSTYVIDPSARCSRSLPIIDCLSWRRPRASLD